jgi:hypothetical protein
MTEAVLHVYTHTVVYFDGRTENVKNGRHCFSKTLRAHSKIEITYVFSDFMFCLSITVSWDSAVEDSECVESSGMMINDNELVGKDVERKRRTIKARFELAIF